MKRLIFRTKRSMVIFLMLLFPILSIAQVVTGKVILFEDKKLYRVLTFSKKERQMVL